MAIVRTYDGTSGLYIETWTRVGDVDLAIGDHGFTQGAVTVPRSSAYLSANRVCPNGVAAFVEVDATDEGVPEVCVGYVDTYDASSEGGGDVTVSLIGPATWLDDENATALVDREGTPWGIMASIIGEHPNELWCTMGTGRDYGKGGLVRLSGQSIIGIADQLEDDTGARYRLSAVGGGPRYTFNWGAPVRDRTGSVTLYDDGDQANCTWDATFRMRRQTGELALAIQSFGRAASEVTGARLRAPTHTVGIAAAAVKLAQDPYIIEVATNGKSELRPDIRSDAAAASALRQIASRLIRPDIVAKVTVTDTSLWGKVQAGDLVTTRWSKDPSGWFGDAIAYVFDTSYTVPGIAGGEKRLELGVEVYSTGGGAANAATMAAFMEGIESEG